MVDKVKSKKIIIFSMVSEDMVHNSRIVEPEEGEINKGKTHKTLPPQLEFAIIISLSTVPTLIFFLVNKIIDQEISKIYLPLIAFPINFLILYGIFFKKAKIPIVRTDFRAFLSDIGFKTQSYLLKSVLIGILLGICSTFGMWLGSYLSGKFVWDWERLTWEQVIFATVPGFWEEIFYRGLLMAFLLKFVKSIPKAIIIQSAIFALVHFYGIALWDIVDIISIFFIGLAFSYVAYKTNSLIPGIIFHFLHDAFNFLVQVPDSSVLSNLEHFLFFLCLWIMLVVGSFIVKLVTNSQSKENNQGLYQKLSE